MMTMMTADQIRQSEERKGAVSERVDEAITLLRSIRRRAISGKAIDVSDIDADLKEVISSIRHHCEMLNNDRAR